MFPLPPVAVQRDLVAASTDARAKAAEIRREAATLHVRAGNEFEAAVYGKIAVATAEAA